MCSQGSVIVTLSEVGVLTDSGKSRQFTGILDCLQKTVTREGLYAPFKGLQLALYELAVCQGLQSVLYVGMSKFLDSRAGLKMLEKMSRVRPWMHNRIELLRQTPGIQIESVSSCSMCVLEEASVMVLLCHSSPC